MNWKLCSNKERTNKKDEVNHFTETSPVAHSTATQCCFYSGCGLTPDSRTSICHRCGHLFKKAFFFFFNWSPHVLCAFTYPEPPSCVSLFLFPELTLKSALCSLLQGRDIAEDKAELIFGAFVFSCWKHVTWNNIQDIRWCEEDAEWLDSFANICDGKKRKKEEKLRNPHAQRASWRSGWFWSGAENVQSWFWQLPKTTRIIASGHGCQVQVSPTDQRGDTWASVKITGALPWHSGLRIWHVTAVAGSLLWHKFDPQPRNFHMPWAWPKKRLKMEIVWDEIQ